MYIYDVLNKFSNDAGTEATLWVVRVDEDGNEKFSHIILPFLLPSKDVLKADKNFWTNYKEATENLFTSQAESSDCVEVLKVLSHDIFWVSN